MPALLRLIGSRLNALLHLFSPATEKSRVIVGSTGSGKSEGELVDLVRIADRGDCAIVLLDGHGPLTFRTARHWHARGHEGRMVYEPLRADGAASCGTRLPSW